MGDVKIEKNEGLATITIAREERRNALSSGVVEELIGALEDLGVDDDVRVIVLTGAGDKAFCAGGDISDMSPEDGMLAMHHKRGRFADLMVAMHDCHKPIIGRINGQALGGGFGLALNCDICVSSEDALFGTPEIKLGLFPMMIMAVIVRNIGRKAAMELMLTGSRIDAQRALEMGVVNRVVPADNLDDAVSELADRISGFSPAILRLGRQAFYDTQDMGFEESLRHLHGQLTINTMTEDASIGVMAFMSKSTPEWTGR